MNQPTTSLHSPLPPVSRRQLALLLLLAALITLLNAVKPLHIDDAFFHDYAVQIAHHPLDPYGFNIFWVQWPEPAITVMCPPVLPYWWAIGIKLFGATSVFLWKLWLFPFLAAFVFALHGLLRRFAPAAAMPLTWMTALSPAFLPAINYMLDVPAIALALTGLCCLVAAVDRRSIACAILAGIAAGLATETKYTALIYPPLFLIYGLLHRRFAIALLAAALAMSIFASVELLEAWRYGTSHFWYHLHLHDLIQGYTPRGLLFPSIVPLIGGLAAGLGAVGIGVLTRWRWIGPLAIAVVLAAYLSLTRWPTALPLFMTLGELTWIVIALLAWKTARGRHRDDWFLILWLLIEIAGFAFISPFNASRRVMGIILATTFLVGRLASQNQFFVRRPRVAGLLIGANVVLGLGFCAVDLLDARALNLATQQAIAFAEAHRQRGQSIWFTGHWEPQFQAEQADCLPVVPDHSILKAGDWLIRPTSRTINAQKLILPDDHLLLVQTVRIDDLLMLTTTPYYYGGYVVAQHRTEPRAEMEVDRVQADFIPPTSYRPADLARWISLRGQPAPPAAIPALLRAAHADPADAAVLVDAAKQALSAANKK